MSYLTDRSRIIAFQRCNRLRYWQYEWAGRGLSSTRTAIPLVVGGAVHKGLEELLNGYDVEVACASALREFDERSGDSGGFVLQPNENALYVVREQRSLTEALVRVFALRGLPELLNRYDVLEVEREDTLKLTDLPIIDCTTCAGSGRDRTTSLGFDLPCEECGGTGKIDPNIYLMARADGLLRDKRTGELYILSFKTASYYDKRTERQGDHDVQGLSEMAAVEGRLRTKISGTQMIYLIKGNRSEYPSGSGIWTQNSPLVRPWKSTGVTRASDRYAWSYQWQDETGSTRRLGKDWRRINIWEEMPIAEWVEMLHGEYVQPEVGDALASICLILPVNYRREDEMRDWLEQVTAQELMVADSSFIVRRAGTEGFENVLLREQLNLDFPQYRHSCDYPSRCFAQDLCFGPPQIAEDPLSTGLFQLRRAHHEPELKAWSIRDQPDEAGEGST